MASEKWTGLDLIHRWHYNLSCNNGLVATLLGKPILVTYDEWNAHLGFLQNAKSKKNI